MDFTNFGEPFLRGEGSSSVSSRAASPSRYGRAARTSVGTRLRPSSRLRRLATVRVGQGAGVVNVYARVALQEQTTEAHRMFQRDHAISDIPGDTPIDREAATTSEQNTVWRTIGRDRAAERRILEAILEETGGESG